MPERKPRTSKGKGDNMKERVKKYKNNRFFDRLMKFAPKDTWLSLAVLDRTKEKPLFKSNMQQNSKDNFKFNHTLQKGGYCNYIGLNSFKTNRRIKEVEGESNVANFSGFFFDFDDGDQEKIDNIISKLGEPSWKINSTPSKNKWQLIYLFDSPVAGENASEWEEKSKALTNYFEADHCYDISRVMRLPLSLNGKPDILELVTVVESGNEYSYKSDFNIV